MSYSHQSALVIGASMGGLLAARALSNQFANVTIIERDVLPDTEVSRKGVPQSGHAHGLLAGGYRVMDAYFPDLFDELESRGAPRGDVVGDFLWYQYGRWKLRHQSGLTGMTVSRPCLEAAIRKRVKALPNVRFIESAEVHGLSHDTSAQRVTGLEIRHHEEGRPSRVERCLAELVIDSSGRGSHSPKWLEAHGYGRPQETIVKVDVGYATRVFERRPGDFFSSMGGVITANPPESSRYAAILAAEEDRWVVTLAGSVGDYPPTDEAGWLAFAKSIPVPEVYELFSRARPLSDIAAYRFPANRRMHYERMKRFPAGYLVLGDALCSFNPIYGQGMTTAATEAKALESCVQDSLDGISKRFYSQARKIVDIPWSIATGEDFRFPQVEGQRPPGYHLLNRYLDRVHALASADPVVCKRFFEVLSLLAPPTALLTPAMAWRVMTSASQRYAPLSSAMPGAQSPTRHNG